MLVVGSKNVTLNLAGVRASVIVFSCAFVTFHVTWILYTPPRTRSRVKTLLQSAIFSLSMSWRLTVYSTGAGSSGAADFNHCCHVVTSVALVFRRSWPVNVGVNLLVANVDVDVAAHSAPTSAPVMLMR